MFKKRQYFSAAAVLIFVCLSLAAVCANTPGSAKITAEERDYGRTSVKLVQVLEVADARVKTMINEALKNEAVQFAKKYQSEIFEFSSISSQVKTNQNNILSVLLEELFYPARAAHPTTVAKAFNFDLKTGKNYTLSEIFAKDAGYKSILDTLSKADLKERKVNLLEPFTGIDERQEFYLEDNSLVLFYQLYKYTPYSDGFLEIKIPFARINDILDDKFKLPDK